MLILDEIISEINFNGSFNLELKIDIFFKDECKLIEEV